MKKVIKIAEAVVGVVVLVVLILWLGGFFTGGRIEPGEVQVEAWEPKVTETVRAEKVSLPLVEEAVGTLRPETEANISAQTSGRILSVEVRAGDKVTKGQILVRLDDSEIRTRVEQARQQEQAARAVAQQARDGLSASEAQLKQAESQYNRIKSFHDQEAATTQQLEEAESAYSQAQAGVAQAKQGIQAADADVKRAEQGVREANVGLGYSTISAPTSGEISKRLCEPGDLAWPGKPLMAIQSERILRLEANVRETLIGMVPVGTTLSVYVPAIDKQIEGTVDEVAPSADAASRSFLVKVRLGDIASLYPGMYGKLLIPSGTRETVVVPSRSIRQVGQLKTVLVRTDGRWDRRYVQSGLREDDRVEILSGLVGGEELGIVGENVVPPPPSPLPRGEGES
ncbi:MAG: efflux RND transporter periplasmic adaptor subunit [bacterium]